MSNIQPCKGKRCPNCGKCRDWYYTGDAATATWLRNWKNWPPNDWYRYRDLEINDRFTKRPDATCTHFLCIIDGENIPMALHFHKLGANAFYHAHQDLCLCNDNVRH